MDFWTDAFTWSGGVATPKHFFMLYQTVNPMAFASEIVTRCISQTCLKPNRQALLSPEWEEHAQPTSPAELGVFFGFQGSMARLVSKSVSNLL